MNFQNFITRDLLKNLKKLCRQFGIFHYLYLPLLSTYVKQINTTFQHTSTLTP